MKPINISSSSPSSRINVGHEATTFPDGTREWTLNGKYHREDGPAVECSNGTKFWYLNGHPIDLETSSSNPKVLKLQEYMKIQELVEV